MLAWLVPIGLFFITTSLYLGAMRVDLEGGGGARQVIGLLITFVLFLLVWWLLGLILGRFGAVFFGVIVPAVLAVLALPLLVRAAYLPLGVRVVRSEPGGH